MPVDELPNDDRSRLSRIGAAGEDMPMTLKEACRVVFKDAITPAALKAEAHRGNLVIRKIGRAYFVTWRDIKEMWDKRKLSPQSAGVVVRDVNKHATAARSALRQALLSKRKKRPRKYSLR